MRRLKVPKILLVNIITSEIDIYTTAYSFELGLIIFLRLAALSYLSSKSKYLNLVRELVF